MKVMITFGTRPEAIKMIPIIKELEKEQNVQTVVCTTGQHRDMLDQVLDKFNVKPNYKLDIMKANQTISYINAAILEQVDAILKKEEPDIVLVHGDTTTSLACAQAAFYNKIKIGHVEAGLRTYDKYSPFPEEMNRVLISKLADLHFAPTLKNKENLLNEGIKEENIFITGNTVIDAMKYTISDKYVFNNEDLKNIDFKDKSKKYIVVTAHRRENLGKPLENICDSINELVEKRNDIEVIYPVHKNPKVREIVFDKLKNEKIKLIEPLDVFDMHNLMNNSYLIMTDSGGLQEEAPALGKPVLVLRENTERPEAIEAGVAKIVGNQKNVIFDSVNELLDNNDKYNEMSKAINPYGVGDSSRKIVDSILKL